MCRNRFDFMWRHFHISNEDVSLENLDETQGNYKGGNNDEEELVANCNRACAERTGKR